MASDFKIKDLRSIKPECKKYFFDANCWLLILSPPIQPSKDQQVYLDFFSSIVNLHQTQLSLKKKTLPYIIVSPLLISEIFNRSLRISFQHWKDELFQVSKLTKSEVDSKDYKKDYRKTTHYDLAVATFQSDFLAFRFILEVLKNEEGADPFDMLKNFPPKADFNDHYYYLQCYDNKVPIVTHDGDFSLPYVEILTTNQHLLKLK